MPIPNEYREIISALSKKTSEGVLNWTENNFDISVNIDKSQFALWQGTDEQTDEPFVAFALKNQTGKAVDSWYLDQSDAEYSNVFDIYRSAKRHANGVPSLLKTLAERISTMKSGDE